MENDNLKRQKEYLLNPKKRKNQPNFVPVFHFERITDLFVAVAYAAVLHLLFKVNME